DRADGAKPLDDPGILFGDAVAVAVKRGAAGGGRAGKVEAVFDGNREPPERVPPIAEGAAFSARHLLGAFRFAHGPFRIAPEIGIAVLVLIGIGQGCLSQARGSGDPVCQRTAKVSDGAERGRDNASLQRGGSELAGADEEMEVRGIPGLIIETRGTPFVGSWPSRDLGELPGRVRGSPLVVYSRCEPRKCES